MNKNDIVKRTKQIIPDLLDLADYYNFSLDENWTGNEGANLGFLSKGLDAYTLYYVPFDVRGIIQLAGGGLNDGLPAEVKNIRCVDKKCRKMHFMHGTVGKANGNTLIGEYILNYEGGEKRSIPIIYGMNVKDCLSAEKGVNLINAEIISKNEKGEGAGDIKIYKYSVNDPLPDAVLKSIDFVSSLTASAPFVTAITVEPAETEYESFTYGFKAKNPIRARSKWAGDKLVDLTDYYNACMDDDFHNHEGHDLQDVPKGLQEVGGVVFDIRGLIQLAAGNISLRRTGVVFPESIKGIEVRNSGEKLHFLHACGWSTPKGVKIGEYVVNYANSEQKTVPLVYGQNIADWWDNPENDFDENTQAAWKGYNAFCDSQGVKVTLQKLSWENPLPGMEIESIDFVSTLETAGPFLVAVTLE